MHLAVKLPKVINNNTFGIFVSLVFIVIIATKVDFNQVLLAMKDFNIIYAIPAAVTYALSYLVRASRWKELLSSTEKIHFTSIYKALYVGYMANTLLPARMGEIYRAHFLGTEESVKRTSVFASIITERVFDGLTLFCLLIFLVTFSYRDPLIVYILYFSGAIFLTGFLFIILVSKTTLVNKIFSEKILSKIPEFIHSKLQTFMEGLMVIGSLKSFAFIILTSITAWFLEWLTMYTILLGFDIHSFINPITGAFLVVLVAFSTMIPSGPAFVGPYQYGFIIALGIYTIPKDMAIAISITTQAVMMGPVIVIGLLLLWKSHLSLFKLDKLSGKEGIDEN